MGQPVSVRGRDCVAAVAGGVGVISGLDGKPVGRPGSVPHRRPVSGRRSDRRGPRSIRVDGRAPDPAVVELVWEGELAAVPGEKSGPLLVGTSRVALPPWGFAMTADGSRSTARCGQTRSARTRGRLAIAVVADTAASAMILSSNPDTASLCPRPSSVIQPVSTQLGWWFER